MATSKKPRKKYRPRGVILDPINYAVTSVQPITKYGSHILDVKIKNHDAMNALLYGKATVQDMDILIAMTNVVEALYRLGFGKEYEDVVVKGLAALYQIGVRGYPTSKFICKLPEVAAMNELMELHDAQMDVITVRDMEKALDIVKREFRLQRMRKIGGTK
jgi:uncharacterized membrane-anchored protein